MPCSMHKPYSPLHQRLCRQGLANFHGAQGTSCAAIRSGPTSWQCLKFHRLLSPSVACHAAPPSTSTAPPVAITEDGQELTEEQILELIRKEVDIRGDPNEFFREIAELDRLDEPEPEHPKYALPVLPRHLQHMIDRPWVMAMQLRWVQKNIREERAEKSEYVYRLAQQPSHVEFSRIATHNHMTRLQVEIARLGAILEDIDERLAELQQTECWQPR